MKRLLIVLVLLAAAAAGIYWYVGREKADKKPAWRTEPVSRGDVTMSVTATGTLSAVTTVQVGSQVSGIVAKLYADFNSRVTRGQLLAELDPTNFEAIVAQRRADLTSAEVQARNASLTYDRQKRLLAEGLTAQGDYDTAKANFDAAQAQVSQSRASLEQALTNLKYTKILSPIDGVVVDRQYDIGQTVAASFQAPTLFTIAQDLTRMQVQADVDQSDIGRVQVGQHADFTVDAYPDQKFTGNITQIRLNATVSQNVITYPVIIEVANPGEKLRPKMTADVTIEVAQVRNALRVPNGALRFRPPETEKDKDKGKAEAAPAAPAGGGAGTAQAATTTAATAQAPPAAGAPGAAAEGAQARGARGTREPGPPAPGAAAEGGERRGGKRGPRDRQTVYLVGADGTTLKPVEIRTGITDGRQTEVLEGDLKEGDQVVVGTPTTRSEAPSGRGPGMRPF